MVIKNASGRLAPHLLVDTHRGDQARCENNPGARTGEGLWQASELYAPLQAWQRMGEPTIAINATSSTCAARKGAVAIDWLQLAAGRLRGQHQRSGPGQPGGHRHRRLPGKQGLSGGGESWSSLTTMILPTGGAPYVVWPRGKNDYDSATPVVEDLLNKNEKFVAVVRHRTAGSRPDSAAA